MMRFFIHGFFVACLCASGISVAQQSVNATVLELIRVSKNAATQALNTYEHHTPDQPLWKDALRNAEEAARLAPQSPDPQRLLAQIYTTLGWNLKAWQAWQAYELNQGVMDAVATQRYADVGRSLGYESYTHKDLTSALAYYRKTYALQADDSSLIWVARLYFELGDPVKALPFWQQVVATHPDDAVYAQYLTRTQNQITYGIKASNAYEDGLKLYEAGAYRDALEAFSLASTLNTSYRDAFMQAGTVALELELPEVAVGFWERAVALERDDKSVFFLALAREQVRWGVKAVAAFREGERLLSAGDTDAAARAFEEALDVNPGYAQAWAYLAEIALAQAALDEALVYATYATALAPDNQAFLTTQRSVENALAAHAQTQAAALAEREQQTQQTQTPPGATPDSNPDTSADTSTPAIPDVITPSRSSSSSTLASSTESGVANAQAVVLLDMTYTHQSKLQNGQGAFSFFSAPQRLRTNLNAPLNFANGTLYQRVNVLSKPSEQAVKYQLCLIPDDDISIQPACSNKNTLQLTSPGTYESSQSINSFSNYQQINWQNGILELLLVVNDTHGEPLDDSYLVKADGSNVDILEFFPMQVHYTAVWVPDGASFTGWP